MKIENAKDLGKLIALCRKQGIKSIKIDGIELELGEEPVKASTARSVNQPQAEDTIPSWTPGGIGPDTKILTDELSPDQLLFYSADGGAPNPEEMS